jgi:hypothetical protein
MKPELRCQVEHVFWYSTLTRRCVWRTKRAWLPDAHYWMFPPRLASHNIGGWYFEHFRRDEAVAGEDLAACVPILAAAHLSLETERRATPHRAHLSAALRRWWPGGK